MSGAELFEELAEQAAPKPATSPGAPRVQQPRRDEPSWQVVDLDALIGLDHPARLGWSFVTSLEMGELYAAIKACRHTVGRTPIDPRLLLALWLYAVIDGVGSAREIVRLCQRDLVYRWLCGGVSVNYHALWDFRGDHEAVLDRLLTDSVTALVEDGLISLERLAQDGVKVRAAAGAASFRRRGGVAARGGGAGEAREDARADRASQERTGERRRGRPAPQAGGPAARRQRVRGALPQGLGAAARAGDRARTTPGQARCQRQAQGGTRLDHGCRGAGDEDGGRRFPAGLQRPGGRRSRQSGDRRRRDRHPR